jgi:hypothetical protein
MAVQIGTYSTVAFGAAGSQFGSLLNINVVTNLAKTLNADNYPILAGKLPGLAWIATPAGGNVEATHDGGSSWWPVIGASATNQGSGIWFLDGFTSRTNGTGGNMSIVFLTSQQS